MLTTERLILRPWWDDDLERFAAINADPEVMRFFPAPLSRAESDAFVARIMVHAMQHGFGIWAVEAPKVAPLIGMVGLRRVGPEFSFAPAVDVSWRLGRPWWGRGYATEAARAAIADGFARFGIEEIVASTAAVNTPSRAVMERLGMTHDPADDFLHPRIPADSILRRHVLYRLRR
jgi:ribosomal-protein-alanine N-acetyltransferase